MCVLWGVAGRSVASGRPGSASKAIGGCPCGLSKSLFFSEPLFPHPKTGHRITHRFRVAEARCPEHHQSAMNVGITVVTAVGTACVSGYFNCLGTGTVAWTEFLTVGKVVHAETFVS